LVQVEITAQENLTNLN